MAVCGTNITIRGTMSDETGTVQAQVVNGDGTTNMIAGLVERNNMFWLENVPLNGTNQISIQAIDAAGNVAVTNFTVKPDDLILTISSTPTGDDLWHGAGAVYGTVSDTNVTVTVNGTNAVVDGSYANADGTYNWMATGAPIYGEGTATFDAVATPSVVNLNMVPANASLAVKMQPYMAMVKYDCTEIQKYTDLNSGYIWYQQTVKSQSAQPAAGPAGQWALKDQRVNSMYWYEQDGSSSSSGHQRYTWSTSPPDDGQEHMDDSSGYSYDGPALWPSGDPLSLQLAQAIPHEDQHWGCASCGPGYIWNTVRHYFAKGVDYHWDLGGNTTFDLSVNAATQVKLFTGGKALVGRRDLFEIDATATEIQRPPLDYGTAYPWWDAPGPGIANASLMVAGKSVGANGKLWKTLPGNSPGIDITVHAPGKKHYNSSSGITSYALHIIANDNDLFNATASFCVGQKITFGVTGFPDGIDPAQTTYRWEFQGIYVNDSTNPIPGLSSTNYFANGNQLTNAAPYAWWVSGGGPAGYPVSVTCNFVFTNGGGQASGMGFGLINMFKPDVNWNGTITSQIKVDNDYIGNTSFPGMIAWLHLGGYKTNGNEVYGITFKPNIINTYGFNGGKFSPLQVVAPSQVVNCSTNGKSRHQTNDFGLDNDLHYDSSLGVFYDEPGSACQSGDQQVSLSFSYQAFLMFNPDKNGTSESIDVPLRLIAWQWQATATNGTSNNWGLSTTPVATENSKDATGNFPMWRTNLQVAWPGNYSLYTNANCNL